MLRRLLIGLTLLCSLSSAHAKVILWDLGGVLFEPDKIGVALDVGITNFLSHAVWDLRSPNIQAVLFDVLSMLNQDEKERRDLQGSAHGLPLPPIMCKWQAGTVTGQEIINRAQPLIKKLYTYDYFDSKTQMELILKCIQTMFNPALLAKNIYASEEGVQLMKESYRMVDKDGKKMHRQFCSQTGTISPLISFTITMVIYSGTLKRSSFQETLSALSQTRMPFSTSSTQQYVLCPVLVSVGLRVDDVLKGVLVRLHALMFPEISGFFKVPESVTIVIVKDIKGEMVPV